MVCLEKIGCPKILQMPILGTELKPGQDLSVEGVCTNFAVSHILPMGLDVGLVT